LLRSSFKPACPPVGDETVVAIAPIETGPSETDPPAESPGSRNPNAAVVIAGAPGVSVAGAGGNVGVHDRAADNNAADKTGPPVTTPDKLAAAKVAPDWPVIASAVAAAKSTFRSTVYSASMKFLWCGIGCRCACSKQSCNQSYSESEILHCVPHGNLPFVPAYELGDCELL
jgi:hypothetical protein